MKAAMTVTRNLLFDFENGNDTSKSVASGVVETIPSAAPPIGLSS
jgi:hypothetical protein